ncbi:alanyl-tRNA editing protein [Pseudomonas sp. Fl5BN2]|uniref:alanyl-tRNA editing protein n=1 Tax=unclassified Pseudomonas TaxID=196821 RepID=UPI0013781E72|nr:MULTISPECIES: alanyl-tRNA editing protein [unclassified Pseudomonas]NBF01328.1 alanyl-tRNA editing protein [Pseudomonas sp. Fl5BN2]NBF08223.1 alanyl-tRNA editing protein [Pseudomonas sp. Fl4BN1]
MTLRLYYQHDQLTAQVEVLSCTPHDDLFATTLDATPFHPQGGGQPSDTGWIGAAQVQRVMQEGEQIVHYLDQPLKPGVFEALVNETQRLFNSRMHSAGHLIGHFVQSQGWTPIKAHHWPGEGRVSFKPREQPEEIDGASVQSAIEQWVNADLERHILMESGSRQISFGPLPAYGCGGTHVRHLQALGQVTISSISEKKGILSVCYSLD